MFKEILHIIPQLSSSDLANMERSLTKRFGNVAKKFGKGLVAAMTGGGIAGAALGIIDKLLNPLKETQEAIDRVLDQADTVVTNAKQFGATPGELYKLQGIAKSTGLDAGGLDVLLTKFMGAVVEAKNDPTKPTAVRAYVGEENMVAAFYEFIQELQKLKPTDQFAVQAEVFGEKQILKMADFLQADFFKQQASLGYKTANEYTPRLEKAADLKDLQDIYRVRLEMADMMKKADLLTESMVKSQADREKRELARENQNVANYHNLARISEAADSITFMLRDLVNAATSGLLKLGNISGTIQKFEASPLFRGILNVMKGGK